MQAREALVELSHERGRVGHHAAHVPHRHRRRCGVDLAEATDEPHHERRVADRRRHRGEDADRQRCHVRHEDVVGEQVAEVRVHEREVPVGELTVAEGAEIGALVAQPPRDDLVVDELGKILGRERPPERLADPLGLREVDVARLLLVGRDAGLRPEELLVHRGRRETGRALAEQTDERGVQVAVATRDAELLDVVGIELVVVERADTLPCVAPPELGEPDAGVAGQRRDRIGEHLADVRSCVDRPPGAELAVGDPALDHVQVPLCRRRRPRGVRAE